MGSRERRQKAAEDEALRQLELEAKSMEGIEVESVRQTDEPAHAEVPMDREFHSTQVGQEQALKVVADAHVNAEVHILYDKLVDVINASRANKVSVYYAVGLLQVRLTHAAAEMMELR